MSANPVSPGQPTLCGQCFRMGLLATQCMLCKSVPVNQGASVSLPVGTRLDKGKFVIGDLLGSPGGFGMAYLGWDEVLQRKVVIKELFPRDLVTRESGDCEVQVLRPACEPYFVEQRALFLDEARTLAKLDGVDSVVRVIHYFAENKTAYFVMPRVPGRPLSHFIRAQIRLDGQSLMTWMWPLMEGLAAVHQAGLLHRDVKPDNVLIDERNRPVLIDFGSATLLAGLAQREPSTPFVSPFFGAPEQYANDNKRMGPWTDIYALGALMYYCLSGTRPTDAKQRLGGEPLQPLDALAPQAPPALRDAINRCMALDEHQRPQDIAALQASLESLRPATRHWVQALPGNTFGNRQRGIHGQVQAGKAVPRSFNLAAGVFQWFWFLAHRLTAVGAISAALTLLVTGLVLNLGASWQMLPVALAVAWLVAAVPCALFADALLYRRVSAVGASLPLGNDAQWLLAQKILAQEGCPHPVMMLSGMVVPLGAVLLTAGVAQYEATVRARVERAMALEDLRERVSLYQVQHGAPPSAEDLGYVDAPNSETRAIEIKAGSLDVVLAVSGADGRRVRWRQWAGGWKCESVDLAMKLVPLACRGSFGTSTADP